MLLKVESKNGNVYYKKPDELNRHDYKIHYEKNRHHIQRKQVLRKIIQGKNVTNNTLEKYEIKPIDILNLVHDMCVKFPDNIDAYVLAHQKYMKEST